MAKEQFENLRLSLMQDVLPVGMAMMERVRVGGFKKVLETFRSSNEPLQELRSEGELAANSLRDQLDQFYPGLGNPVVPVEVEVSSINVDQDLIDCLNQIESRLNRLDNYLATCSKKVESSRVD